MSNYSILQTSYKEIRDPELKNFVDHVTEMFKTTTYQSLVNISQNKEMKFSKLKVGVKEKKEYDTVAAVVHNYLKKKDPQIIKNVARYKGPRYFIAKSPFRTVRRIDLLKKVYTLKKLDIEREFNYINDKLIFERFGNIFGLKFPEIIRPTEPDPDPDPTPTEPTPNYALKLNLSRVKCIDETDPEWGGKDEINVGGVAVDDKEVQSTINEFHTGDFNDGGQRSYNPVKVLKSFPLDQQNPSTFAAFLTLAEKDSGGFSDFLQKLYDAIKANLTEIMMVLGAAAGAAIGAAIGGTVGTTVGGPLGAIIGILAGLILGALVGWLVETFRDDIFDPQITGITLYNNQAFVGPTQTLSYQDFGGKYVIDVFWSAG